MFEGLKRRFSNVIKSFSKEEKEEIREEAQGEKSEGNGEQEQEEKREGRKESEPEKGERESPNAVEAKEEGVRPAREEPRERIRISTSTKVRGAIFRKVKLNDSDIDNFLEMLRTSMLESDVSYSDAEEFSEKLSGSLREARFDAKGMRGELLGKVRESLLEVMSKTSGLNMNAFVSENISKGNVPVKVLFIGSNGTGKTTTIAKVAHMFKLRGISSVISASDTFRAAAIEQTEHHARALGIPVIKSSYGADPASVAFDAVSYARAHGAQVVLIDSAGRQETNRNLIGEMQKMDRVIKPDLNIYVGESTAGSSMVAQIAEFRKAIRIDGIILTKLDCDARGGSAISIANSTGIPILFLGTGESYSDLMPYDPQVILDAMLPAAE